MTSIPDDSYPATSIQPSLNYVTCPGASKTDPQTHRMAYWQWGDASNPRILMCVHGLSRQGRDFDALASSLSDRYQVICPDVVGRGRSDWLADPKGYEVVSYVSDMVVLIEQVRARRNNGWRCRGPCCARRQTAGGWPCTMTRPWPNPSRP